MPLTTTAPVQSPISLCQRSTAFKDGVQPLEFFGHWDGRGKAKIVNNGASAMVSSLRSYLFLLLLRIIKLRFRYNYGFGSA